MANIVNNLHLSRPRRQKLASRPNLALRTT